MSDQVAPHIILNGQTPVAVPGTAVVIGLATVIRAVTVKALADNVGDIYVGNATVDNTNGFILSPGESVSIAINSRGDVYIDADNAADAISYIAVV